MNYDSQNTAFNLSGIHVVDDTTATTAAAAGCAMFKAIKALGGDVVIASLTSSLVTPAGGLDGVTISNGDTLLVPFSAVTLTSGVAVLTKA